MTTQNKMNILLVFSPVNQELTAREIYQIIFYAVGNKRFMTRILIDFVIDRCSVILCLSDRSP